MSLEYGVLGQVWRTKQEQHLFVEGAVPVWGNILFGWKTENCVIVTVDVGFWCSHESSHETYNYKDNDLTKNQIIWNSNTMKMISDLELVLTLYLHRFGMLRAIRLLIQAHFLVLQRSFKYLRFFNISVHMSVDFNKARELGTY